MGYLRQWLLLLLFLPAIALAQVQHSDDFAKAAYVDAASTFWLAEGQTSAKHVAYVLVEPNCHYCKKLYQQLAPEIAAGNLQVRWIVAAFLQPSSVDKGAAILQSFEPVTALRDYFLGQGTQAVVKVTAVTRRDLQINERYVQMFGFGTPALIYRTANKYRIQQGLLPVADLAEVIRSMSGSFD